MTRKEETQAKTEELYGESDNNSKIDECYIVALEVVEYLIKSGYQPVINDTLGQKHFQIKFPRHKDDFFLSEEYEHCREILGEYYYEGCFAGDVYILYVLRQKEQKHSVWRDYFDDEVKRVHKHYPEVSFAELTRIAYHFAKWAEQLISEHL